MPGRMKQIWQHKEPGSTKINMLFILLGKHLLLAISRLPLRISTMQSKSMPCMSPMIVQLSSGEMDNFLKCGEIKNKLWHVNSLQTMASNFLATSKQILHLKLPLLQIEFHLLNTSEKSI